MSEVMIEARNLCKSFFSHRRRVKTWAVNGLNLVVHRGETFGLLGADGAGKTTTLRLLNGLFIPDSGEARVAGFDTVKEFPQIHLRAGYMPQQFALYGDMSVRENLQFFARVHGLTRAQQQERIPRLLRFARLEEFQGRLAAHLSGGMKKKLALACMLVHQPEVVFLDEPTLGVDPVSRREFWNLLSDLRAERGLTIFVCTPYMDEAERCHRVGLLYEGRLIASGTPEEIKRMIPGDLIELWPSVLYAGRDILAQLEGVLEVQTYGDLVHVFVDNAEQRIPEIEAALIAQGITIGNLRRIAPRMEQAFIFLIKRQRTSDGGGCS